MLLRSQARDVQHRQKALSQITALAVISETGADRSRCPTDGHFASWMGLCPGAKITGG